jgi:predicted RNA-binding protein with TRAM domain
MRISSLVDSTYRLLVGRLQRGGTGVKSVSRPGASNYRWGFRVFVPGPKESVFVLVEVGLMTKNVYKNDKVEVVISGLVGTVASRSFEPISGNCPSLDVVEAFIRTSLSEKQDLPEPQSKPESSSVVSDPVTEIVAASEGPAAVEQVVPILRRKDKSRRCREQISEEPIPTE